LISSPEAGARSSSGKEEVAMGANEYLLECLVRERLEAERRWARNTALAAGAAGSRRTPRWRSMLGHALIRLGRALASEPARRPRPA
jgi:hypothetical protein